MAKETLKKTWKGAAPVRCDICASAITLEFFDSRTRSGRWGNLCRSCWTRENGKLGTGQAQRYVKTSEAWLGKGTVE
jgi:hypothetical protein